MPSREATVFLCGDVMAGRGIDQILAHPSNPQLHEPYVRSATEYLGMAEARSGKIPRGVGSAYIWGDALAELERVKPAARVVNLETSITTSDDWEHKGINYRMHPKNVACLAAAHVDCCCLANNHVLDWGQKGLTETTSVLHKAGIRTTGAGRNRQEAELPAAIDIAGGRVLVFAVGSADSGIEPDWAATESEGGVWLLPDFSGKTAASLASLVHRVKKANDIAVLSIHWGGNFGYEVPREHSQFARTAIDSASIDIVYGHSSHHPKGMEIHQGKLILYGCGDFINDYEGISGHEQFRGDLALMYFVTVDIGSGSLLRLEMSPFKIKRFRLERAVGTDLAWLESTLDREAAKFGHHIFRTGGTFVLDGSR